VYAPQPEQSQAFAQPMMDNQMIPPQLPSNVAMMPDIAQLLKQQQAAPQPVGQLPPGLDLQSFGGLGKIDRKFMMR
jgi:hypothetical protein